MKYANNKNGVIIINKPKNLTSRDVVNIVQKKLNTKAGHTGTLDPLAKGVLVICLGKATKLSEIITHETKEYEAEVLLGIQTDTLDIEGVILKENARSTTKVQIKDALNHFKKTYIQEVPQYSAVKINGKKLYEYARNGEKIKLPKREVTIYDIKLLEYKKTSFKFYCKVSKGTYIRSLIRDICNYLNTIGVMSNLMRISQGKFQIKDAYNLEELEKAKIIKIEDAIDIPKIKVDDKRKFQIINGVKQKGNEEKVLYIDKENTPLAIYKKENQDLRMWKMLYDNKQWKFKKITWILYQISVYY